MSIFPTRILLATDGSEEAELSRDARLRAQALRADPRGVLAAAPRAVLAGESCWGDRGRVSPENGEGGPGGCGFGQGARSGTDCNGLPGPWGDPEGHRGEYLRCSHPPCPLCGSGGALAREIQSPRAAPPHPFGRRVNGLRMDAFANPSRSATLSGP